ncbi:spore germination protein [Microaerobacter geothermalis]|uniref:spore germination protein n=1 Tax=Microaerobacter geothermalis TaxID=674972 RepID=UPI0022A79091
MKKESKDIQKKLEDNKKILKDRLGLDANFDIGTKELNIGDKEMCLYYIKGFANDLALVPILGELADVKRENLVPKVLQHLLKRYLNHQQVTIVKTMDELVDQLLSGAVILLINQEEEALIVDAKSFPGRNPEEPDTERVVRGSRDGFTENIIVNTALTRRRIRDERLRMEILRIGERSKTDVCIGYLQDVADPGLVKTIKKKLSEIKIDGIPMAEKTVEEFLVGRNWNPFPLVRYTERPDVAAIHLLEGHVLIYVDTSPSIMITPTTFFHHVQHAEEYRQTPVTGAYFRWVRFLGMLTSLFLLPLWLLFVMDPSLLPEGLKFIGPKDTSKIPIYLQFIIAELGIDIMRMAAVHTPTPLATAMGLIAAVLIGEVAMKVGLFVPEVILYISVAALGMFATPSYELSVATKVFRIFLLLMVAFLKVPGFVLGVTFVILILAMTRSLNTPYLWPFIPFNGKALLSVLVRTSTPTMNTRPSIVHPQNRRRQP